MGGRLLIPERSKPWLLAVAAALPFQLLHLADLIHFGDSATGFVLDEMPYYAANARAYFDHGFGFLHPNPYDAQGPSIYFQLSTWLIGVIWRITSIDPGLLMALLGVIFSVLTARVTYSLVKERLPDDRYVTSAFLLVMYSGGLLVMPTVIEAGVREAFGASLSRYHYFTLDPQSGWWFLNWGRNMVLTTESLYHFLMASAWLMFLRERWLYAVLLSVLVAAAHPWTGVLSLSIMGVWIVVGGVSRMRSVGLPALFIGIAGALAFAWYYGLYLNQFPSHRAISEAWTLAWTLEPQTLVLSLLAPMTLCAVWLRRRFQFGREEAYLLTCFVMTLLWSKHELFMEPIQPLHFNRGYPWLALALLALSAYPVLAKRIGRIASVLLIAFLISDNVFFLAKEAVERGTSHPKYAVSLDPAIKQLFRHADESGLRGIVLTDDLFTSYLAPTYSKLTPYVGHRHLTPDYKLRSGRATSFIRGAESALADSLDYFICHDTCIVNRTSFVQLHRVGVHALYRVVH